MNVTLCCVDSTLRIKREDKITDNRTLSFLALKGGYDSAQLIIRADKDLSLHLTAKDLRDENGNVFSKDNFKFYYEKYIMALSVICCSSFIFLFVDPNLGSFFMK